ncbi:MAG: gamma-glutamyltransferase, partial [Calditrichota bacterium]
MLFKHLQLVLILFLAVTLPSPAAYRAPVWSTCGMAATPHPAATKAAVVILEAGGSAVDAAVAAVFALAVVEPYHSGLGGGEFALASPAGSGEVFALDARECAPAAATPDMFLDPITREPQGSKSWLGGLAVGIPGSVAGRIELHRRFGKLTLKKVMEPSIRLAR